MKERLTTLDYWNKQYRWTGRPSRIYPIANLAVAELDKIFKKFLPVDEKFTFLEVGCAPGIWMDYFHRTSRYNVEGIEYTDRGVEKTRKNLEKLGTPCEVHHQDFFDNALPNKYDVVFSGGFIEHFEDADDVVGRHINLLKRGGIAVIEIPNLSGWNGIIQKRLNKDVYEKHNIKIMNPEYFREVARKLDLEVLYIGYIGKINLCLFSGNKPLTFILCLIQRILTVAYTLFGGRIFIRESALLSPFLIMIARKRL